MSTNFTFWRPKNPHPSVGVFKKDFVETKDNGMGLSDLPTHIPITQVEFMQAALETGYGPQIAWPTTLWMDSAQRADLCQFISQRAQSVACMFDFDAGLILPKRFSKCLESSEWSAMSYMVGQICATIAVKHWLGPSKGPIEVLHKSVFANASLVKAATHTIPRSVKVKLVPDLLVKDSSSAWHLLEAKGGKTNFRARAVNKGLAQVDAHDWVQTGGAWHKPLSRLCSFVQIDRPTKVQKPLRFDVVDPDGDQDGSELIVFEELALAMTHLLIDSTIRTLPEARSKPSSRAIPDGYHWRQTGSPDVLVAVPDTPIEAGSIAVDVALMLMTKQHLRRKVSPRFKDPRKVAEAIVEATARATGGFQGAVEGQNWAAYVSQVEEALDSARDQTGDVFSIVPVWNALSKRLDMGGKRREVLHTRIFQANGVRDRFESTTGLTGAIYVSATRAL